MKKSNTGAPEQKILIVNQQLIHTYINSTQQQLLPSNQSIKCLKLAFYLLHANQFRNYINHTNTIEHSSVCIQELGQFFNTSQKAIRAEFEKFSHPLIDIKSISNTHLHFSVDISFFDTVRVTKNDTQHDKKEKLEQSYYIDLETIKSERSTASIVLKWFKSFYGSNLSLERDFLFELFGFQHDTANQRKNAVRTLKRVSEPLGYRYDCFRFSLTKGIKSVRQSNPKMAQQFDRYVCHFKKKRQIENPTPCLPDSFILPELLEEYEKIQLDAQCAYAYLNDGEVNKEEIFW